MEVICHAIKWTTNTLNRYASLLLKQHIWYSGADIRLQDSNDAFEVGHAVFIWLFRASRNWISIESFVPQMRRHLRDDDVSRRMGKSRRFSWNDDPEYLKKFKERLAIAAVDLKLALQNSIENVGVLYDKMIYTGTLDEDMEQNMLGKVYRSFNRAKHVKKILGDSESVGTVNVGRGQVR